MKKIIVTTSINAPTEAIRKFDAMQDWDLVVIGDLKTPSDYWLKRRMYLDALAQEEYDKDLSDAIGWNCIQRRNFGLLIAHDMKADVVAVVDDDNIPLADWGENLMVGKEVEVNFYETDLAAFDPIGATNYPHFGTAAIRYNWCQSATIVGRIKGAQLWTSKQTFGTESPISTLYAVWSMPRNAILIPTCSPSLPTGLRHSTHRTLSSQAP